MVTHSRTTLLLGYFVGFIAIVAPVLGFIAPKGIAPLVILGSIAGFAILKAQNRQIHWLNKPIIILFVCLCLWAALSIFWSIDGRSASIGTLKLIGNLIAGGVLFSVLQSLNEAELKIAMRWFLFGFLFILGVVALELVLGNPVYTAIKNIRPQDIGLGGPYWLNTAVVVLVLLIWPLCVALVKLGAERFGNPKLLFMAICVFVAVLFLAVFIRFQSGALALMLGILSACVIWFLGRRAAMAASILFVLVGLLLPTARTYFEDPVLAFENVVSLSNSAKHRIAIWDFTVEKIEQKTLFGWGMNASRNLPDGKSRLISKSGAIYGDAMPLHPHNAILQMWLELGLPGIILYLTLGVYILMAAASRIRSKFESSMMVGQFVTIMIIANLSFGVWQAWWIATLWLSAALMAMVATKFYNQSLETLKPADEEGVI